MGQDFEGQRCQDLSKMLCWFNMAFKILHVTCIQSTISDVRNHKTMLGSAKPSAEPIRPQRGLKAESDQRKVSLLHWNDMQWNAINRVETLSRFVCFQTTCIHHTIYYLVSNCSETVVHGRSQWRYTNRFPLARGNGLTKGWLVACGMREWMVFSLLISRRVNIEIEHCDESHIHVPKATATVVL